MRKFILIFALMAALLAFEEAWTAEQPLKAGDKVDFEKMAKATAHSERGAYLAEAEKYKEAIGEISKAIELDPNYRAAIHNRAVCYIKLGMYDKAWEDVRRGESQSLRKRKIESPFNLWEKTGL